MKKRFLMIVMVLAIAALCFGCTQSQDNPPATEPEQTPIDNDLNQVEEEETGVITVQQYFASAKYVYDGQDDENGELMPAVELKLTLEDGEDQYLATVNSLETLPQVDNAENYITMKTPEYVCNGVTVTDGIAYVDFSSDKLEGSSLMETILIDQVVYTLSNTFDEIGGIRFTVDGEDVETLMGHVDTSQTFVADYL